MGITAMRHRACIRSRFRRSAASSRCGRDTASEGEGPTGLVLHDHQPLEAAEIVTDGVVPERAAGATRVSGDRRRRRMGGDVTRQPTKHPADPVGIRSGVVHAGGSAPRPRRAGSCGPAAPQHGRDSTGAGRRRKRKSKTCSAVPDARTARERNPVRAPRLRPPAVASKAVAGRQATSVPGAIPRRAARRRRRRSTRRRASGRMRSGSQRRSVSELTVTPLTPGIFSRTASISRAMWK